MHVTEQMEHCMTSDVSALEVPHLKKERVGTATISVNGQSHEMPVLRGTRGPDVIDVSRLYKETGYFTYDPGFTSTASCDSELTFIDGKEGILAYRGYPIDQLAEQGNHFFALKNYLVRLGWSHGDDEIFTGEEMISLFGLDAIGRSAARFDFGKLENLNGHYIRNADPKALVEQIKNLLPHLEARPLDAEFQETESGFGRELVDVDWQRLERAMPGLQERAKTLIELIKSARYLFATRPLRLDVKAGKILKDDARALLGRIATRLKALEDWSAGAIEAVVRELAEEEDLKLGKVAQPLRAALTGTNVSPGIFDVLAVLDRDEALARLEDQARSGCPPEK